MADPDVSIKIGIDDKEALAKADAFQRKLDAKLKDTLKAKISTSVDQSEFDAFATKFKASVKSLQDGAKLNLGIKLDDAGQIAAFKTKVEQLRKESGADINVRFNVKQDSNVFNQINQSIRSVKNEATDLSNKVSLLKFQPKVDLSDVKKLKTEAEAIQGKIIELSKTGIDIKTDVSKLVGVQDSLNKIQSEIERTNSKGISIKDSGSLDSINDKIGGIGKLLNLGFVLKFTQVGLDGIIGMVQGIGQGLLGGIDMVSKLEGNQVALEQALFNQNKKGGQDASTARVNASNQSQTISDAIIKFAGETPFSSSNIFGLATQLQNRGFDVLAGTNNGQNKITSAPNNILNVASDLISRQVLLGKTQDEATMDFAKAIAEFKGGQYTSLKTRFDIGNPDITQAIIDAGFGEKTGINKTDDLSAEAIQKLSPDEIVKVFGKISENLGSQGLSGQQALTFEGLKSTVMDGLDGLIRSFFGSPKDSQSLFSQMKGALDKSISFLDSPEGNEFKKQLGEIGKSMGSFIEEALTPGNIKAFGEGLVSFGEAVKTIFSPENIQNAVSFFETVGEKFKEGGLLSVLTTNGDEYASKSVDKSINRTTGKIGDLRSQLEKETDPVKRQSLQDNISKQEGVLSKLQDQQKEVDREANKPLPERASDLGKKFLDFKDAGDKFTLETIFGKKEGGQKYKDLNKNQNKGLGLGENASTSDRVEKTVQGSIEKEKILRKSFTEDLPTAILKVGDDFKQFFKDRYDDVGNFYNDTKDATQTWFKDRYDDLVKFKDDSIQSFVDLKDGAIQKFNELGDFVKLTFTETIPKFIEGIPGFVETKFNEAKDFGVAKLGELKDFGIKKIQELKDFIFGVPKTVDDEFGKAKDNGNSKLQELRNFANDKFNEIKNGITGIPKAFGDAFESGKNQVSYKLDQMRDFINRFASDAKQSVGGIWDSFTSGLMGREPKASGGAVFAGGKYTVAEEGKELFGSNDGDWKLLSGGSQPFDPDKDGFIFPNEITEQLLTRIQPQAQTNNNNYNFTNKFDLPETSERVQGYYSANKLLSEMDKQLRGQLA